MRAAIYARLSMDRDSTSAAVDRQEADCRQLCADRGWEVVDVFIDNDVSAYSLTAKRPGFEALLKATGHIEAVVVWKTDRLARRGRDLQRFLDAAEPHGTQLISCTEPEFAGPTGLLMLRIVSGFAEHESSVKAERVARANKERAAKGKPHGGGGRKFGYTADFKIEPIEAKLIRRAAAKLIAGESGRSIAREWNQRGILTVAGVAWVPGNFKRMMRAPYIAGLRSYHGELMPGSWKPILDLETWELLQIALEPKGAPKAVTKHLFSGITRCICGARMFGVMSKGHAEYRCNQDRGCGKVSIRAEILEAEAMRQVFDVLPRLIAEYQSLPKPAISEQVRALDADLKALDELNAARYVERTLDHRSYVKAKASLEAKIEARRSEIGQAAQLDVVGDLELMEELWPARTFDQRRRTLEATVDRIVVSPGRGPKRVKLKPKSRAKAA